MLEPHAPHESIHTWKGFMIHIGAIAVGLLLALTLEQAVAAIHHAHQRHGIESRIHSALEADLRLDVGSFAKFSRLLAYLVELRNAVSARIGGADAPLQPPQRDARVAAFIIFPGLAPYEAAQSSGTVALLDERRIRLYNRLSFARQLMLTVRDRFDATAARLEGFQRRYTDAPGFMTLNAMTSAVDLRRLSNPELIEYRERIGDMIATTEELRARVDLFDLEARSLLNGATSETQMLEESIKARPRGFGIDEAAQAGKGK